jgi:hypothetical protein
LISAPTSVFRAVSTVERCDHALEAGQLFEPVHLSLLRLQISARDVHGGDAAGVRQSILVALLLRRPALANQDFGAAVRHLGKLHARLRLHDRRLHLDQLRTRLAQLLIEFGGLDLGEEISLADTRTDVEVPACKIAARAGVDRRVDEGRGLARQRQLLVRRVDFGMHDVDDRHCRVPGVHGQ